MGRVAWTLTSTDASPETYSFEVNPKTDAGSFSITKSQNYIESAGPNGQTLIHERVDDPIKVSYSGVLLTELQYDALVTWAAKEDPVILTDDLGQSSSILIDSLEFTRAPRRHYPWRHEFTLTGFVMEVL